MLIIETPIFTKLVNELMSDDEYRKLQEALVNRPDMGALIKKVVVFEKCGGQSKVMAKVVVFELFIIG